jgi:hypothetical protein
LINPTKFQYVTFENPLVGPPSNGWTTGTEAGYTSPTTFIAPSTGYYKIDYKVDVNADGLNGNNVAAISTTLICNGAEINGSVSLGQISKDKGGFVLTASVIVSLATNDRISLLFWSNDTDAKIGEPALITGLLPGGAVPVETTASISFIKIA